MISTVFCTGTGSSTMVSFVPHDQIQKAKLTITRTTRPPPRKLRIPPPKRRRPQLRNTHGNPSNLSTLPPIHPQQQQPRPQLHHKRLNPKPHQPRHRPRTTTAPTLRINNHRIRHAHGTSLVAGIDCARSIQQSVGRRRRRRGCYQQ